MSKMREKVLENLDEKYKGKVEYVYSPTAYNTA